VADIGTVLDELEKPSKPNLRKDQQPAQLSLFSEDERNTAQARHRRTGKRVFARIPAERLQEGSSDRNPLRQAQTTAPSRSR